MLYLVSWWYHYLLLKGIKKKKMGGNHNNDIFLAFLAFLSAFLFTLKNYKIQEEETTPERIRRLMTGSVGSMITVWAVFEILFYFQLPERLCLALAGASGYLGAEVISKFIVAFIDNKISKNS